MSCLPTLLYFFQHSSSLAPRSSTLATGTLIFLSHQHRQSSAYTFTNSQSNRILLNPENMCFEQFIFWQCPECKQPATISHSSVTVSCPPSHRCKLRNTMNVELRTSAMLGPRCDRCQQTFQETEDSFSGQSHPTGGPLVTTSDARPGGHFVNASSVPLGGGIFENKPEDLFRKPARGPTTVPSGGLFGGATIHPPGGLFDNIDRPSDPIFCFARNGSLFSDTSSALSPGGLFGFGRDSSIRPGGLQGPRY